MGCDDGDANFSTVFTVSRVLSLKRGMRANQSWILDLIDTKIQVMISMSMNETRGKCNEHVQCFSLSYKYAFCDHLLRFIMEISVAAYTDHTSRYSRS